MTNQLGKRFQCESCGSEVLCIKAGDGEIVCCDKAMERGAPLGLRQPLRLLSGREQALPQRRHLAQGAAAHVP